MTTNYLTEVKAQYERLPYPPCEPQDEYKRLMHTWLDSLPLMNHYCFQGKENFKNGFRVLVAGAGTGDATIYLGEQLKDTNAEIVHLDLSGASIAIAKERAAIRKLTNIRWIQRSILDLPKLELGLFDYINCVGVLHHLADPNAGMCALLSVLKPQGAIGLMVYGQIGRTGIYHMQSLLKLANRGCNEDDKLTHAKEVLAALPALNWYKLAGDDYGDDQTDAAIYDSLLHSQDRAYTVPQLFEWLEDGHNLTIALTDVNRGRFPYLPEMTLGRDAHKLRHHLKDLSERDRYAISELLIGDLTRHTMYLTHGEDAKSPYGNLEYIPFFAHDPFSGKALAELFAPNKGEPTVLHHQRLGATLVANPGKYSGKIFAHIDGLRSFQEIFDLVRTEPECRNEPPDNAQLFADFRQPYDALSSIERILLRHQSCR
ncbi:class I SAM-dependent methyltransferase [Undibacterium sp. LX15W]|uniref:Class I SAM-dependent methyltransferase n=1 Tax=Undibacterium flavidum TaxID=2762297 RepID=A0ABR6YG60_9BURK|nr:class I SAM-dependent methyltransferase [Undibacterium flavidum]